MTATVTSGAAGGNTSFTFTVTGGCAGAGQKLSNPGFESGAVPWTATAGVIGQNGPSQPARTGTWNA